MYEYICFFVYWFMYVFIYLFIHLFIYLFTNLFIHLFIYLFLYLFIDMDAHIHSDLFGLSPCGVSPCDDQRPSPVKVVYDKWQIHLVGIQDGFALFGILPNHMSKLSRKWTFGKTSSIFSGHFLAPSCHPSKLTPFKCALRVLHARGARPQGMISVSVGRSWWEYSWCRTWPRLGFIRPCHSAYQLEKHMQNISWSIAV